MIRIGIIRAVVFYEFIRSVFVREDPFSIWRVATDMKVELDGVDGSLGIWRVFEFEGFELGIDFIEGFL
jgi:hypothetical protein